MGPMESAVKDIEHAAKHYLDDLEAMTEAQLLQSAGGAARKAVDFTFEVALLNRRIAARLKGTEPPPAPEGEEWWTAPEELRSKEAITRYMRESLEELAAAARSIPDSDGSRLVGAPGQERPAFSLAQFASMHTMYHDAQLNFIQSLSGDLDMHWKA